MYFNIQKFTSASLWGRPHTQKEKKKKNQKGDWEEGLVIGGVASLLVF